MHGVRRGRGDGGRRQGQGHRRRGRRGALLHHLRFKPNPVIDVEKSVSPTSVVKEGDPVTYTVEVTRAGNVDLSSISVSDPVCTLVYDSGDDGDSVLEQGETWVYTCTYEATQADVDAGEKKNTATAKGSYGDTEVSDTATATFTVPSAPKIDVDKEVVGAASGYTLPGEVDWKITRTAESPVTFAGAASLFFYLTCI